MKLETKHTITILAAAVFVLALAQAYTLTRLSTTPTSAVPQAPAQTKGDTIPIPPSTILRPLASVVQSADASRIVLSTGSSATTTLLIDPSTSVVTQGALKDSAQQEADMEAFRTSSSALSQDPVKNKLALQTLIAPAPFKEIATQPSAIAPGSNIIAYTFVKDGALHAVKIIVLPAATH